MPSDPAPASESESPPFDIPVSPDREADIVELRRGLLRLSLAVELGVLGLAGLIVWGWPREGWGSLGDLQPRPMSLLWGVLATGPLLLFFFISVRIPWEPFRRIHRLLVDTLGPSLRVCRWYELAFVATLAGVGEEALFRGALQPRIGLVVSNLLFGLAHAVTPTYAILVFLLGLYLGWLAESAGLCAAMLAHGLYDFVAFLLIARSCNRPAGV